MSDRLFLHQVTFSLALIGLALSVAGTKACQDDYELGTQSSGVNPDITGTSTPTPTETEEGGDEDTPTPTPTATATATVTATAGTSGLISGRSAGLFDSLAELSDDADATAQTVGSSGTHRNAKAGLKPQNWLGKIYSSDSNDTVDSDGDGYTDRLELDSGSDLSNRNSTPPSPVTRLDSRLNEDQALGSSAWLLDTDKDGFSDAAEVASGTDPRIATSFPSDDTDKDTLGAAFEHSLGLNSQSVDSDGDGLRDDQELAFGADPRHRDSDRDGILDGKEFELGSDPMKAEPNSN